jgi:hypothetical protein
MATTTNYGWTTPDDTALVKDGASAIRTLGSSIDTTTKNLNPSTTLGDIEYRSSTANVNTRLPLGTAGQVLKVNSGATAPEWATDASGMTNPMTTTGDTIYSSSGSTPARLAIGSTGQILTVAAGVPSWATPAGANQNFSLLNAGGTSLVSTPAASSKTITGLSGYNQFYILVYQVSAVANTVQIQFQLNGDTGANYIFAGHRIIAASGYSYQNFDGESYTGQTELSIGRTSATDTGWVGAGIHIFGANSSGNKVLAWDGGGNGNDNNTLNTSRNGIYTGSSVISSITIKTSTGSNIDSGTIYIYGSA